MSIQQKIERKLTDAFQPERLEVINESHLHAGHHHVESGHHAEFDGSGETHFRVRIIAGSFAGMSRIDRHRAVNDLLKDELSIDRVHALAIEPAAPGEATRW
jgi:BolA protein